MLKQIVLREPKIVHISAVKKDSVVLVYSGKAEENGNQCYGMLSKQKDGSYNLIRPNGDGQFMPGKFFTISDLIKNYEHQGWNFYILDK